MVADVVVYLYCSLLIEGVSQCLRTTPTLVITSNYVTFSKFYRCRRAAPCPRLCLCFIVVPKCLFWFDCLYSWGDYVHINSFSMQLTSSSWYFQSQLLQTLKLRPQDCWVPNVRVGIMAILQNHVGMF